MKRLLLFFALCSSLGAWAQTATKSVSADGKTMTLTCTGDVTTGLPNTLGPTGNKLFTAAAKDGNEYGKVIKSQNDYTGYPGAGESCPANTDFYLKIYLWNENQEIPTTDGLKLKQNVYQYDGTSTYALKKANTSVTSTGSYWLVDNEGTIASADEIETSGKAFDSSSIGWVYKFSNWNYTAVTEGEAFVSTNQYVIANGKGNYGWNDGVLTDAETTLTEKGYLINTISSTSTLFEKTADGDYVKAAGKGYNASSTYYKDVTFTSIDITSEDYSTAATVVNIGTDEYYIKVPHGDVSAYLPVADGEVYDEAANYCTKADGATSVKITRDADDNWTSAKLEEMGFVTDEMAEMSFWKAVSVELVSKKIENVKFVNADPSTQLTIDYNIITAILYPNIGTLYNKYIRTLDLGQTTIPGLNTKDFIDNTTNGYYVNNISVTDLTIPLVPAVDGQVVVPEDVISTWSTNAVVPGCLPLTTVRIPEGYTKLGDNAFRGFSRISTFVLPSTLKEIGNSAFENSGAITAMTLNSGLKYIGKRAFMGTHLSSTMDEPFVFPSSLDKIDDAAFGSIVEFHNVKLVDGLRYIGNSAFYLPACDLTQEVLSVPSSVKYMGPGAFNFRWFKDIYYNSAVAPIAPHGTPVLAQDGSANTSAFDHKIQMGFNGFNPDNTICQNADDAWHGYANRENYQNGDTFFCILHYPANLSEDEHNTYEDVTRIYETYYDRYQTMLVDNGDGTYSEVKVNEDGDCGVGGANFDYNSSNGGGILVKGADVDEAVKSLDGWSSTQQKYYRHNVEEGTTTEYTSAAVVTPGFEDTYKGKQYVWPSQSQWMRAFAESACGYQWDGKTLYRPELTVAELKVYNEAGYLTDEQLASLIGTLGDAEVVTTASVTDEDLATLYDNLQYMAYISTREFVLADPDTKEDQKVDEFPVDIKAEHWWTLCVPFNMTKAQVTESFGEGTHVCRFSKVDRDVVNKPSTIKLYFQDDVYVHKQEKTYGEDGKYTYAPVVGDDDVADDDIVIYAHESYMIYPTKKQDGKATYVVKNYKAETGSPVPTLINANAENTETEDHTQYRYIGNYSVGYAVDTPVAADEDVPTTASYEFVTTKIPAYSYMYALKKNDTRYKFWFTQSDNITWAPYKCVVQATAKDGGIKDDSAFFGAKHESKQISIFGNEGWDEEATDIENVIIIAGSGNDSQVIYNLNGQVMNPNNATNGIYIKNGKKYFAR